MSFTHYPKLEYNVLFCWVLPVPPVKPPAPNAVAFHELNQFKPDPECKFLIKPELKPGETVYAYHSAQNFTRFYGTCFCDQPLQVQYSFSNDEVSERGEPIVDEDLSCLHYDGEAAVQLYDPQKQGASGKILVTIYGRWLRVAVKNVGQEMVKEMRLYVRGSVF